MSPPHYPHVIRANARDAFGDAFWLFVMAALGLAMLPVLFFMEGDLWTRLGLIAIMLVAGGGAGWWGVVTVTMQTVFEAEAVTVRTAFGTRRFERASLDGWRFSGHQAKLVRIELYTATSKRPFIITIPKEPDEIVATWFDGARDLDVEDKIKAVHDVEADEAFGHTKDARVANVDAENRVLAFLWFGLLAFAGLVAFFPEPYHYAVGAAIVVPILIVIATFIRRDRWKLDRDDHDLRPTTGSLIALCAAVLWTRAASDWSLINWGYAILLALGAAAALTIVLVLVFQARWRPRLLLWFAVATMYSYGALVPLNMWLDRERPVVHRAGVGRILEESFQLNTMPPLPPEVERSASREFLRRLEAAGEACLPVFDGAFGIRSYEIVLCREDRGE